MWCGDRTGGRRTSDVTGSRPATDATTVAASAAASSRSGSRPGIVRASSVLPAPGRPDQQHRVPAGERDLERASRDGLAADVGEVRRRLCSGVRSARRTRVALRVPALDEPVRPGQRHRDWPARPARAHRIGRLRHGRPRRRPRCPDARRASAAAAVGHHDAGGRPRPPGRAPSAGSRAPGGPRRPAPARRSAPRARGRPGAAPSRAGSRGRSRGRATRRPCAGRPARG